ncbi:hypothetical protein CP8484711_0543A, partial [Chlamydia psittaci 84-8471/1]
MCGCDFAGENSYLWLPWQIEYVSLMDANRSLSSSGVMCCFPSQRAFSGDSCISIIKPSAPAAIAAFARGGTKERFPAA